MSRSVPLVTPQSGERWTARDLLLVLGAFALVAATTLALTQREQLLQRVSTRVQPIALLTTADFHALAFDPGDPNVVYFGHHNGVLKSINGGVDWKPVLNFGDAMSLATSPDAPNVVIAAGHLLLMRSEDRGATWDKIENDLPYTDIHGFALNPSDSRDWFAYVVGYGLFRSRDAGVHWTKLSTTLPETTMALAVVPGESMTLFAGTMDRGVLKSTDGGLSWSSAQLSVQMGMTLRQDPRDPTIVYAGTGTGLWRLDSSSARWEQIGLKSKDLMAVGISPANPERFIAVDAQGRVYRSEDEGRTW